MSPLPPGWAEVPLAAVADTRLGKMLSSKSKTGVGSRPYLRNKNVQWGRIDLDDVAVMDFTEEEFNKFRLDPGDLLICEGGEVGRSAIWRGTIEGVAYQKALHRVRAVDGVLSEYLLYLFMHYGRGRAFERFVTGSTIAHLPQENLRTIPVPLPATAEQRRIVEAIEEQFSRLDAGRHALAGVERAGKALRARLLGSLTQDWPSVGLDELVGTKPHALKAGPFGSALKKSFYVPSGYKVYGQEQVLRGDAYYGDYYIDGDRYEALKSCAVAPRDVLISLVGTVGMALVLPADAEPGIINPRLAKVTLDEELMLPEFLCVALQAPCIRHQIALTAHGGTMDVLNLSSLKKLSLPLPPVAAQRSIIGDVERIDSILQTLFRTVHDVRTRAKALRQRILQEAFAGRLVEQDPRDEPASLLLKRIRSERYSP